MDITTNLGIQQVYTLQELDIHCVHAHQNPQKLKNPYSCICLKAYNYFAKICNEIFYRQRVIIKIKNCLSIAAPISHLPKARTLWIADNQVSLYDGILIPWAGIALFLSRVLGKRGPRPLNYKEGAEPALVIYWWDTSWMFLFVYFYYLLLLTIIIFLRRFSYQTTTVAIHIRYKYYKNNI